MSLGWPWHWLLRRVRTLMPPIFNGQIVEVIHQHSGHIICSAWRCVWPSKRDERRRRMSKERELTEEHKKASNANSASSRAFSRDVSGIMSAGISYGYAAGKPIGELRFTTSHGRASRAARAV